MSGDHALTAARSGGSYWLQIIDVSDPTNPVLSGSGDTLSEIDDIAVWGDHAFVSRGYYGILMYDVSDPGAPVSVASWDSPGFAHGLHISGRHLYVADQSYGGLQVVEIDTSVSPPLLTPVASCDTPGQAGKACVAGDHAYVADGSYGLRVIRVACGRANYERNHGRSEPLRSLWSAEMIVRARLATTQNCATIGWRLASDAYFWEEWLPDGAWHSFGDHFCDIWWTADLITSDPMLIPTVSSLQLDWLYRCAAIDSVVDVPGDQGGHVRLHLTRSGFDFADETEFPLVSYCVWRRVDDPLILKALSDGGTPGRAASRPAPGRS